MKTIMMLAMAFFIGGAAMAQKVTAAAVPAAVKTAFAKQYPVAVAKWEKENGSYEVNFKTAGKTRSALYATDGKLIESEMDMKVADLPAAVLAYVKEHYKGKTIKEAAIITKADGTVNYEAEVAGMDVIFSANGKFIKEMKD